MFDLSGSRFLKLSDALLDCFRTMNSTCQQQAGVMWFLRLHGQRPRFAGLLLRQFLQPMVPTRQGVA